MLILIIVAGVLILWLIISYNSLVSKRNSAKKAFASIDVMLKKRYDLIPNLVAAVQQYMKHERETLTRITETRARATSGNISDEEKIELDQKLSRDVSGIMIAVENYPELKASTNFLQLQGSLNEVEEQLSAARRFYNTAVTDLNNAIQMFPTNIVASAFSFQAKKLFESTEPERQNVDVKSMFN
ncbi:MAG: LemA family protein [Bacteroidales bacterium]